MLLKYSLISVLGVQVLEAAVTPNLNDFICFFKTSHIKFEMLTKRKLVLGDLREQIFKRA